MKLTPENAVVLGHRVFSIPQYRLVSDIADREIFMIYEKDFISDDEYTVMAFDGSEKHSFTASESQLNEKSMSAYDFLEIAAEDIRNKLALNN